MPLTVLCWAFKFKLPEVYSSLRYMQILNRLPNMSFRRIILKSLLIKLSRLNVPELTHQSVRLVPRELLDLFKWSYILLILQRWILFILFNTYMYHCLSIVLLCWVTYEIMFGLSENLLFMYQLHILYGLYSWEKLQINLK